MTSETLERIKIETTEDIVYGGGLPVSVKDTGINKICLGNDIFKGGEKHSSIVVSLEPTIVFDAGYEMTGRYLFEADDTNIDTSSTEKIMDYINNGKFNLSIEYQNEDEMPYNNWTIKALNEEVLREIENVSEEDFPVNEHLFDVGDRFGFDYETACREIAFDLERGLQLHQIPYSQTGLTEAVVIDFHKQLRQDICDFILTSQNNRSIAVLG